MGGTSGLGRTQKSYMPNTNSIMMRYQRAGGGCKQGINVTSYTLKTLLLYEAWEIAQSVNGFPHKQEDLSSNL